MPNTKFVFCIAFAIVEENTRIGVYIVDAQILKAQKGDSHEKEYFVLVGCGNVGFCPIVRRN
jgi:hypothetical protein